METVNRQMARGAAWMVSLRLASRLFGIVSTVILARLLAPRDFGLVAAAMSIIGLLELLGAFSFDVALIQNQEADRRHYDTAWTFNVLLGLFVSIVLLLLARPAASFYGEPGLAPVLAVLALWPLVSGLENIGVVAFRKELTFHKEFFYRLAPRLASFFITVPLAFLLRSYWALVIGMLSWRCLGVVLSYVVHGYRPRLSLAARGDLFHFSKWLLITNVAWVLRQRSVELALPKFVGTTGLGFYTVGHEIATLPSTELVAPINRAVFPGFARLAADRETLRNGLVNVLSVLAVATVPAGAGIAVTADSLVPVFLGERWLDAIPLVQILAVYGMLAALQSNFSSVYLALGMPRLSAIITLVNLGTFLALFFAGTYVAGTVGTAWAFLANALLWTPINVTLIVRVLGVRLRRLLAVTWRPLLAVAPMCAAVRLASGAVHDSMGRTPWATRMALLAGVLTGVVVYSTALLALWRASGLPDGGERIALSWISRRRRA